MTAPDPNQEHSVLPAMQLGWLAVESFGLLRRYVRFGRAPAAQSDDAGRRFNFTERELNLYEQLMVSLQRLEATAAQLTPNHPPPIPKDRQAWVSGLKADKAALDGAWGQFENWSRDAWHMLLMQDPLAGQAFACGGDLADTYWYAQGTGAGKLAEMLRSYRLEYLAERVKDLAAYLPEHAARAILNSLERWSIGETVKELDKKGQDRLLERLEAQIKVWRDLLFGLRQANSYLTVRDQRRVHWQSVAASAGLVLLVALAAWLAVLLLAGLGRSLMGSTMKLPLDTSKVGSDVLAYLSNWQNWSALLATASSVLAVLTGVVKGLSGWLWAFYLNCRQALTLRRIQQRTYRAYDFESHESAAGEEAD